MRVGLGRAVGSRRHRLSRISVRSDMLEAHRPRWLLTITLATALVTDLAWAISG